MEHPTRRALEENVAALEGAADAHAFASGMAAIEAVFSLLTQGEHAIVTANAYGGTYRLCQQLLVERGLAFSWVDTSDSKALQAALRAETRLVFVETPSNPLMTVTDIDAVATLCHSKDLILAVDNTFLTPFFQRPLELGADLAVHSVTKFLNGHSDVVGGIVAAMKPEHSEKVRFVQQSAGAVPGALDCFLALRGIKTLALRMERHDRNGREVAAFLEGQPKVRTVHYPGLAAHPQHELAARQASGFGSLISLDLGSLARAREFLSGLRLCTLAESLGGVETLISHPASMSHASLPQDERRRLGVGDGLLRLSVGIEDVEDILEDLERGLDAVSS
jgi:cystathionine gamma-lyase/cystathionine beta-lyase/cystathionine gamma-lyase/homocysteine desulfhydrase